MSGCVAVGAVWPIFCPNFQLGHAIGFQSKGFEFISTHVAFDTLGGNQVTKVVRLGKGA